MTASPSFAAAGKVGLAQISAANTNRDGTGTIVDVVTAGASGSRVYDITVTATGTTTAGIVRLFLHNGSNYRLLDEIPVSAITPSGTVKVWTVTRKLSSQWLPTGWKLAASTHNAETFNVVANYVDY